MISSRRGGSATSRVIIITGQSGAGRTLALRAFEDLGYFCVDNLPPALLPTFLDLVRKDERIAGTAVVIDVRGGAFFQDLDQALERLRATGQPFAVVFLAADEDVLIRRYKASRRAHPLEPAYSLLDAIRHERTVLERLRGQADLVIDTSRLTPQALRERIARRFALRSPAWPFQVRFVSFGYKHGLPPDADLVLDVRFLPNPHYVEHLRPLTGHDPEVAAYVMRAPDSVATLHELERLLDFLLPRYQAEGKAGLTVAIGCTGGRHRSVVFAERLAEHVRRRGYAAEVEHRDVGREEATP